MKLWWVLSALLLVGAGQDTNTDQTAVDGLRERYWAFVEGRQKLRGLLVDDTSILGISVGDRLVAGRLDDAVVAWEVLGCDQVAVQDFRLLGMNEDTALVASKLRRSGRSKNGTEVFTDVQFLIVFSKNAAGMWCLAAESCAPRSVCEHLGDKSSCWSDSRSESEAEEFHAFVDRRRIGQFHFPDSRVSRPGWYRWPPTTNDVASGSVNKSVVDWELVPGDWAVIGHDKDLFVKFAECSGACRRKTVDSLDGKYSPRVKWIVMVKRGDDGTETAVAHFQIAR